jgi:DNA polymerase-3 subunit delta'
VWLLCAPSPEDVLPTIRSRTRHVMLRTPPVDAVAATLRARYGVDEAMAAFAARASQGHIGRARALATDEQARLRRQEVLRIPGRLRDLPSCLAAAADLLDAASEDAKAITDPLDAREEADLLSAYGDGADGVTGARVRRLASSALKEMQKTQKSRRTRTVRDQLDRALVDLLAFYRDVLVVQTEAEVPLVNEEMRPQIEQLAAASNPVATGRRLEAVSRARLALQAAVAPLLALEALTVELKDPTLRV